MRQSQSAATRWRSWSTFPRHVLQSGRLKPARTFTSVLEQMVALCKSLPCLLRYSPFVLWCGSSNCACCNGAMFMYVPCAKARVASLFNADAFVASVSTCLRSGLCSLDENVSFHVEGSFFFRGGWDFVPVTRKQVEVQPRRDGSCEIHTTTPGAWGNLSLSAGWVRIEDVLGQPLLLTYCKAIKSPQQ